MGEPFSAISQSSCGAISHPEGQFLLATSSRHREPVFLVSAQRSGSTLLRIMLDHHPRLAFPHQFEFSVDLVGDDGSFPEWNRYRSYLEQSSIFSRSGFRVEPGLDYLQLQDSFLEQRRRGRDVVGGSIHRHFRRILHVWPSARLIHLVRDPRPVARSVIQMGWEGNVWSAARRWVEAEQEWDRVLRVLPGHRRTEVRYEHLVADPVTTLKGICDFLGVAYDPQMLDYPAQSTYDAPDPVNAERWRELLSSRECALVEARVGSLLEERGYARTVPDVRPPSAAALCWLRIDNRIRKARFAIRRYGPWLWGQRWLAGRIPWSGFRLRVHQALQAVDARYVR